MKVLLDVCTPVPVHLALPDHEIHKANLANRQLAILELWTNHRS